MRKICERNKKLWRLRFRWGCVLNVESYDDVREMELSCFSRNYRLHLLMLFYFTLVNKLNRIYNQREEKMNKRPFNLASVRFLFLTLCFDKEED